MKKELIICIIILIAIIVLNILTQNNTENTFAELENSLSEIRDDINIEKNDNLKEKIDNLTKDWKEKNEILSYYIEHNELEKLEMYIWELNSYIETEEYSMAIQALDTCKYMISHIKEKYELSIKNIF